MQFLVIIGLLLFVLNMTYWMVMFRVVGRISTKAEPTINEKDVALIIVTHNDLDHLQANLAKWMTQNYDNYTVVIVDDGSADGTLEWLRSQVSTYDRLEIFSFKKQSAGKKESLSRILKQRHEPYIVLTDSDCEPASEMWISKVTSTMAQQKGGIFLGYGPLHKSNSWINKLARFETMTTALHYFTWSSLGYPYMGVGRNLAYHRDVYKNYKVTHPELASGDDDLFVQSVAGSVQVVANLDRDTFVYSNSKDHLWSWLKQKSRHVSTSYAYQWPVKLGLGMFGATQILWLFLVIWNWKVLICVLLCRWLIFWMTSSKVMQTLDSKDLLIYWPFLEVSLIISYFLILPWSWIREKDEW